MPLVLQLLEVFLAILNFFSELHGLVSSSLKLKLGLVQLKKPLLSNLRVTVGVLFGDRCTGELLTVNCLEFIDLAHHRLG